MKTMIEFFSGSGKLAKHFKEADYDTLTIDNDKSLNPDLVIDILNLKIQDLPKKFRKPDVIFFGVPCTKFSIAGRNNNFTNHVPNNLEAAIALALVHKCLELIEQFKSINPNVKWFIENPVGYLRTFDFMKKLPLKKVWYCQYGDNRAKPTDIWTNCITWITKTCKNENPNCNHERAPRGSKTGTQGFNNAYERGIYPDLLCQEIVDVCENKLKVQQKRLI